MGMARKNSTLILKNISDETNLETLLKTFKPFGSMSGIRIRSSKKDKNIILGFIEYKSINESEEAFEAIKKLKEPLVIDGEAIEVDYALPQTTKRPLPRRFTAAVTGLDNEHVDNQELMDLIGCMKLDSRNDKILAVFKNYDDLQKALNPSEDFMINGKKVLLEKFRHENSIRHP